jgi:hypothetical protein
LLVYRNNNSKKMQWTCSFNLIPNKIGSCDDRMVVGFTITYTISANHLPDLGYPIYSTSDIGDITWLSYPIYSTSDIGDNCK